MPSRNEKINVTNVIHEGDQIQFHFRDASLIEIIRNQFLKKYNMPVYKIASLAF